MENIIFDLQESIQGKLSEPLQLIEFLQKMLKKCV